MDAQVSRLCGKDGYTSVYCGQGELFRVPALRQRTDAYLELVKQAGAEFAHGAILPETARALRQPLFPRAVFEQMADASWGVSREDTAAAKTPEAREASPAQAFTRQMARSMIRRRGMEKTAFWNFSIRTPAKPVRSCSERTASACAIGLPALHDAHRNATFRLGKKSAAGSLTASRR